MKQTDTNFDTQSKNALGAIGQTPFFTKQRPVKIAPDAITLGTKVQIVGFLALFAAIFDTIVSTLMPVNKDGENINILHSFASTYIYNALVIILICQIFGYPFCVGEPLSSERQITDVVLYSIGCMVLYVIISLFGGRSLANPQLWYRAFLLGLYWAIVNTASYRICNGRKWNFKNTSGW